MELEDTNITNFKTNVTLDQVMDFFNLNLSNVNQSEVSQIHLFDLYEAYKTIEKEQLMVYKSVAYIIGTLIILSNLTVVISSGLILRKGQQPKSTYLLLGNVSLADTIVGFSLIFGVTVDNSVSSNPLCIFQIGMLVCPAMVSIFSVGVIAVDRYIYILHGLYYQRWFNTTRVRIGILCIWMIGITLGFMPATGWTNTELIVTRCYYVSLFPGTLILINSFLSIVPIIVVLVLYTIILIKALKTVNVLNKSAKNSKPYRENMNFRISRGKANNVSSTSSIDVVENKSTPKLTKSASYNNNVYGSGDGIAKPTLTTKSKSNHELGLTQTMSANNFENIGNRSKSQSESMFSICTIQSQGSNPDVSMPNLKPSRFQNQVRKICNINALSRRPKEPNKWRAITIVMLTSGSFVITWMPFFISVTVFVFCEDKLTNPRCMYIRTLLGGPLATLAFLNSLLNPLIYAWWHKGFQESVKNYYRVFVLNCICRISR
ncbi:glucose-dependent insulinotropic receptor-like isoform X1 [Spodoptera litura]|uniref:Glucose-dependent insulinotropic receptor-like isoform X1 n=2 Tax=Spodoptera litura TaxID=69820 RepID=A0A9J7DTY2_SPOLT|nr:glucose-dependent insulinotropic receptor-like isoform X1 [Spodoptera litura]